MNDLVNSDSLGIQTDPRDPNKDARPPRVPMGQGRNLEFSQVKFERDKFHYYAYLEHPEKPGRIRKAEAAYWEYVTDSRGQKVTAAAGSGMHYLMKLPLKYWKEDLDSKKIAVARRMEKENSIGVGEYAPDAATGRPEGGTSVITSDTSDNPYN